MANRDQAIGFRAYDGIKRARLYDIDATTTMFINDLLNMESNGYPDQAAATETTLIGAVQNYRASSATAGTVLVYDDPGQLFLAQADGSDFSGITVVGNNCDITVGTGSSTTGLSAMEIDSSEVTAGAAQIHLVRKVPTTDNAWGANVDMICTIAEHLYTPAGTNYV